MTLQIPAQCHSAEVFSDSLPAGASCAMHGIKQWLCKKKENLHTSSSQLRADQAPDPSWRDRLIYTDQIDVTDQ